MRKYQSSPAVQSRQIDLEMKSVQHEVDIGDIGDDPKGKTHHKTSNPQVENGVRTPDEYT
ncbi:hypothetical protein PGT21_000973 [Puccinia graminis f. sp. tritici]|uniref:Uncharacterized protein n=1 Tax=Puccinia graminis f. sp. tritici TaxID=56615 RepID=A0A5B0LTF1_PUCGR|nr:hypothetical protein PGT21_001020 [Puccinia graminis f. sp. tritici]KAA1109866.1 hypothetical protein PGT21_000973 [Puccinia graminis f. sp. tritici]KAA1137904.1 hypothetical protein PGTUg99_028943 [Puccinia graminis f. sp. tritici]